MSFFKKIFGVQKQEDTDEVMPIYCASDEEECMKKAFKKARETFGYFWRELYWEHRRIVPSLDLACVKICFIDNIDGEEISEHMWINDIYFDGDYIIGTLVNEPNNVKNVKNGDMVRVTLNELSDWLFARDGKTYGGFSIQAMRSRMSDDELKDNDSAWGLNFGDFNDILVAYEQKEHPENLDEHPMSKNMVKDAKKYITQHPDIVSSVDELGFTMLHNEAIAGNLSIIEILLECGADKNAKTKSGKTALDFARQMSWKHIVKFLEK